MIDLLLTNTSRGDIGIDAGRIVPAAKEARETRDLGGRLVTPPLVEPHIHLDAVLTEGQPDEIVVNQIIGIQRALKKVSALLLDHHLHACVTDAMRGPDAAARERVLGELLEVFDATGRA